MEALILRNLKVSHSSVIPFRHEPSEVAENGLSFIVGSGSTEFKAIEKALENEAVARWSDAHDKKLKQAKRSQSGYPMERQEDGSVRVSTVYYQIPSMMNAKGDPVDAPQFFSGGSLIDVAIEIKAYDRLGKQGRKMPQFMVCLRGVKAKEGPDMK